MIPPKNYPIFTTPVLTTIKRISNLFKLSPTSSLSQVHAFHFFPASAPPSTFTCLLSSPRFPGLLSSDISVRTLYTSSSPLRQDAQSQPKEGQSQHQQSQSQVLTNVASSPDTHPTPHNTKNNNKANNNSYSNSCCKTNDGMFQELDSGPEPSYSKATGYKTFTSLSPLTTIWGDVIPELTVAYETWGELNEKKTNAVLLFGGLSASSHAKSHVDNPAEGWWEKYIGEGKALDPSKFFIICCNNLGGCFGSTGPSSFLPDGTGKRYALSFPFVSVQDIVRSQFRLLDHFGIFKLHAAVGSSLGGMLSLAAAAIYSEERVGRLITISAAACSHPVSIASRYTQRRALLSDPAFNDGNYYEGPFPYSGMKLAREIATVTYRSGPEWEKRFGRTRKGEKPTVNAEFAIETYLEHQGHKWSSMYDPNSSIILSKAMDLFTLEVPNLRGILSLEEGMKPITMPTLVMGSKSDILFPIWQQKQIADILKSNGNQRVVFYELDTEFGHDTFLIDIHPVGAAVKGHLETDWQSRSTI